MALSLRLEIAAVIGLLLLLGSGSMVGSLIIAETSQGFATAVNQAGMLRMQSYRIATVLAHDGTNREALSILAQEMDSRMHGAAITSMLQNHQTSASYRVVQQQWQKLQQLLAEDSATADDAYLQQVDGFVMAIHRLVSLLEQSSEKKISQLRYGQIALLVLTILVAAALLLFVKRQVWMPLYELLVVSRSLAIGNMQARVTIPGRNELGELANAVNTMAAELALTQQQLEQRISNKTAALQQSLTTLQLLYNISSKLNQQEITQKLLQAVLQQVTETFALAGGSVCLGQEGDIQAYKIANIVKSSSAGECPPSCNSCLSGSAVTQQRIADRIVIAISDSQQHYGALIIALQPQQQLSAWQQQALEMVAKTIAMGLNRADHNQKQRKLALLEERSVIARELHDSLAQALSYLKIQLASLERLLDSGSDRDKIDLVTAKIRNGLNSAYRELRELLTTFRLQMGEDSFATMVQQSVDEFCRKSDVGIEFDNRLVNCSLNPHIEINALQIIREALTNVLKHADATEARVVCSNTVHGEITLIIEDNGRGMPQQQGDEPHHFGLAIMAERARSLGSELQFSRCPQGGTRIAVTIAQQPEREAA